MSLLATCLTAVLLAPAALVSANALPDVAHVPTGSWTTEEFQSHCPHVIQRLVSASDVEGVWYLQEIVKDGNYTNLPCLKTNFTIDGENIRAITHVDHADQGREPPREDTFPHTEDGLWEDHVSPIQGKILLGFTVDGHLVWCGKKATEPVVQGSVLWARQHAPTITEGTLKSEHQSHRWVSNCPNLTDH